MLNPVNTLQNCPPHLSDVATVRFSCQIFSRFNVPRIIKNRLILTVIQKLEFRRLYRTLIGSSMLEVKPTGPCGRRLLEVAKTGGTYRVAGIGAIRSCRSRDNRGSSIEY